MNMSVSKLRIISAGITFGFFQVAGVAYSQCDALSGFARKACEVKQQIAPTGAIKSNNNQAGASAAQVFTTGIKDAIHLGVLDPSVVPETFTPLTKLQRTDDGAFVLKAGVYDAYVESFNLDAADHGLTTVGAFYPASIRGTRGAVIASVLKNSELHPELKQADLQALLASIVAGTDLEKMTPQMQQNALRVLPRELAKQLQGAAQAQAIEQGIMGLLNRKMTQAVGLPPQLPIGNAATGNAGVLASDGSASLPPTDDLPVLRGTWAQMPGGFYVRYLPDSISRTHIEVIVPMAAVTQTDPKQPLTFDPTQFIAVLMQSPGQRIGITLRETAAPKH